ncbi:MAG: glucose-1-phosphate cytidylyltransferase [Thaumarchaeota archaeon]|nr:glucose-1-phosphate cytidylyltransferase [Nitrososphaerota archaeon]
MKTVILAGGRGTRINEETSSKPKPLIEIGGMPVIWHIMKIYSSHGINDFVICCGYKGEMIKEYFENYSRSRSDVVINLKHGQIESNEKDIRLWNVTLVDTGLETMTGGRIKRIKKHVEGETFCVTYGDDLKGVDITGLVRFHQKQGTLATLTVARHQDRFGLVSISDDKVTSLTEKPIMNDIWINGGYFVLEPKVLDFIKDDSTIFEQEPLNELIEHGQLSAYKYLGEYQPLDTLKDKIKLEELWSSGKAYWKI